GARRRRLQRISRHRGAPLASRGELPAAGARAVSPPAPAGEGGRPKRRRQRRGLTGSFVPRGRAAILQAHRAGLPMKIALEQIRETPRALSYVEDVDALNLELGRGAGDYRLGEGLTVDVSYHRAGLDVFVDGTVHAEVYGRCARCLGDYAF